MPEYYQFPPTTFYRGTGPGVTPMSRNTRMGDNMIPLPKAWVDFIFSLNNWSKQAMKNITDPAYGPSKGYNSNGYLKFISLLYMGRNIVKIERVLVGVDGRIWGVVNGIPMNKIPNTTQYNAFDTPHLVHKVFGVSTKGTFFPLQNTTYVPILGLNWYVPMTMLQKIKYPREVTVRLLVVKVMDHPSDTAKQVGSFVAGHKTKVTKIETGHGGIWGQTPDGWISLRYRDRNYTDWEI
jgi:hypothetical protein